MGDFLRKIFKGDPKLWVLLGVFYVVSIIVMFSAISFSAYRAENYLGPFLGHLFHLGLGFVLILIVHRIPYSALRLPMLVCVPILAIVLLVLNFFIGNDVNNATRSISIMGQEIQTIELAKFAIVVIMSEFIGRYAMISNPTSKRNIFWIVCGLLTLICGLIAVQNLSTAVLVFVVGFILMIIGGVEWKKIALYSTIIIVAAALFLGSVRLLHIEGSVTRRVDTWFERVERHVESVKQDETKDIVITDENRQIINSKIAIANGHIPQGPGNSQQRDFLPLAFSDFIYAVIIEEYGIYGGIGLIGLYIILLSRVGIIARKRSEEHPYEALMAIGLGLLICIQAFISMAVTVELGPVTGQPLPFISRGGMSILMTSFYFAILLSISNQENVEKEKAEKALAKANKKQKHEKEVVLEQPQETETMETI